MMSFIFPRSTFLKTMEGRQIPGWGMVDEWKQKRSKQCFKEKVCKVQQNINATFV